MPTREIFGTKKAARGAKRIHLVVLDGKFELASRLNHSHLARSWVNIKFILAPSTTVRESSDQVEWQENSIGNVRFIGTGSVAFKYK